MKVRQKALLLITALVFFWGCSTYVKVIQFAPGLYPPTKESDIQVFLTGPPAGKEYIEIGTLEVYTLDYKALKKKAAQMGAQAIIQGGSKTAAMVPVAGLLYAANRTTFVAIRWKEN